MRPLRFFGAWLGRARERWTARARSSPTRSALAGVAFLGALVALIAACARTSGVDFLITVPNSISSQVMWIEVSVFDNVQCSLAGRVSYGEAPTDGPVKRLIWSPTAGQPAPPELGELPPGYYSFVAQVKNANCEVIARGCDGLDIGKGGTVRIATRPDSQNGPPCDSTMTCEMGQCVPRRTGQNCSLDVVGSGPLVQGTRARALSVAAPVARSVGNDFLVGYGEFDSDSGKETLLVSQLIARNGGLKPYVPTAFERRCAAIPQRDATGLAWSAEGTGLMGFARNECSDEDGPLSIGVELMLIGSDAVQKDERAATINLGGNPPAGEILFGQNHAMASLGGGKWALAPVIAGRSEAIFIEEASLPNEQGQMKNTFVVSDAEGGGQLRYQFGLEGARHVSANIEASGTSVVMVAINEFDDGPPIPEEDGGEPDPDAGDPDAGDPDAGQAIRQQENPIGFRQASVQFLPIDKLASRMPLPTPHVMTTRFASVALIENRALVVADGYTLQDPTLFAFDYNPAENQAAIAAPLEFAILTNGEAAGTEIDYADVTVSNDRAFVATAVPGDIILSVFSQASTQPNVFRSLRLSQVRASTVSSIRNGRVSVAASQNRVLVAWTTATDLQPNDPIGGYAIFACEP